MSFTRRELLAVLSAFGLSSCSHSEEPAFLPHAGEVGQGVHPAALAPSFTVTGIVADETNALYVFMQTGEVYWYRDTGTTARGAASSHAIAFANGGAGKKIASGWPAYAHYAYGGNGVIYTADVSGSVFWYQDLARNGASNWASNSGKQIASGLSIAQMAGGSPGVLYILNTSGSLLWYTQTSPGANLTGGRVLASNWNGFAPIFGGGDGVLYAISSSRILWFRDAAQNGSVNFAAGSRTSVHSIPLSALMYASNVNGYVYAIQNDGKLFRAKDLSRTGSAQWDALDWQEIGIGYDAYPVVNGYAVPQVATPGQSVSFKLSGGRLATSTQFAIYRLHLNGVATGNSDDFGTLMTASTRVPVTFQGVPPHPWSDDHAWSTSFTQTIPSSWPTGIYAALSRDPRGGWRFIPFVVRSTAAPNRLAVLAYTNTWNAYNDWGGLSQYSNPNGTPLTFNRPNPSLTPLGSNINWTLRAMTLCLSFLENNGIAYDLYTDAELHDGTLSLTRYSTLVLTSHPEYFTMEMRDTIEDFLEAGGTIIYLGANGIYERVVFGSGKTALQFRQNVSSSPPPPRWLYADQGLSESKILGVRYSGSAQSNVAPYAVLDADHALFAGTGVVNGQAIGASGINGAAASGYECDLIDTGAGSPSGTQLLARGQNPATGANMSYYRTPAGGFVFAAGSLSFSGSLAVDPVLQRVVRNALTAALAGDPQPTPNPTDPPSVVQSTFASVNGTSVTATLAKTPTAGNVLLFVLTAYGTATVPTPPGWTPVDSKISGQTQMYRYWRAVQNGDGRSWTLSGVSAVQFCTLSVLEIAGADTNAPVPGTATAFASQAGATVWTACKPVVPPVRNCLPLIMAAEGSTRTAPTAYSPSTWSTVLFASSGEECAIAAGPITTDTTTPVKCNPTWSTAVSGVIGILLIQPRLSS